MHIAMESLLTNSIPFLLFTIIASYMLRMAQTHRSTHQFYAIPLTHHHLWCYASSRRYVSRRHLMSTVKFTGLLQSSKKPKFSYLLRAQCAYQCILDGIPCSTSIEHAFHLFVVRFAKASIIFHPGKWLLPGIYSCYLNA